MVGPSATALDMTLRDRDLGRLEFAWFAVQTGKSAFLVTMLVLAYEAGGTVAVGLMGLASYLTPTVLAPLAALPARRWPTERVLLAANAGRALAVLLAVGIVALQLPIPYLFAIVALEAGAGAATRPLHMALLPCVARTSGQLVAANVTSSAAEGAGTFLGPALAGVLLAAAGPVAAVVGVLAVYATSLLAVGSLHVAAVGRRSASRAIAEPLSAGIAAIRQLPGPRLVLVGFGLQTFVRGLLTVFVVVTAIDVLGLGDPGVGALNAAMGLGGIAGAALAIGLSGRARLAPAFAVSLAGWGAPIVVIGLVPHPAVAVVAMAAIGVANAMIDVSGFTLALRTTPNDRRLAVMSLIEVVANGGVALGVIVAPLLIEALGIRGALLVGGLVLPIAAGVARPGLRKIDEGALGAGHEAELIRGVPMFGLLSLATVEHLASHLTPVELTDGSPLVREGDPGDRFFIIDRGEIEVSQGGRRLQELGSGAGIGEIALLRDVPRTATVRAHGDVRAFALERDDFLEAITGHRGALASATALVTDWLAADADPADGTALH
jgi:predicted MFS family arabinose efflux permease